MPDLPALVSLFYDDPQQLGTFQQVPADHLPHEIHRLLAHDDHMTVTVESYHDSPVDVEVLATKETDGHYARRILLRRQSDGCVVQFGIVRLSWQFLDEEVRREIESQQIPLGRVLISHDVMRKVQLVGLWRVDAGPDLARLFDIPVGSSTFGRTALIFCNGEPAVELLEIVTPT